MGHAGAGVSGDAAPDEVPATAAEEDRPAAFLGRWPAAVPAARGERTVSS